MSDQRSASTSPRRAPVAAVTSRNVAMHHGPLADSKTRTCCAGVSAMPLCFLGTGGSLCVTGFAVSIDMALFLRHHVGIQEGPTLCAQKLTPDFEAQHRDEHELTDRKEHTSELQ